MYVAEEWAKRFRDETKAAHQARETAEDHLSVLRTQQKQMAEQVKQANQDKSNQLQRPKLLRQTYTFEPLWKAQQPPVRMPVKEKKLRPPRVMLRVLLLRSLNQ